MLHLLSQKIFQNRPNSGKMKQDIQPGAFSARLGLLFKENPVSQSDQ